MGPVSKDNLEKDYTWCTISVNEIKTTVLLRHLGRGKFKVIKDHLDGSLIGKILDASDIYHCHTWTGDWRGHNNKQINDN